MQITPGQIRAACAMLYMNKPDLAQLARVSENHLTELDRWDRGEPADPVHLHDIRRTLEQAGIEFIPWGVRKRPPLTPEQQSMFDDIMAISRRSAESLRDVPCLTDDDMYDENGLPA